MSYKKCKVVMLATKTSNLYLFGSKEQLMYRPKAAIHISILDEPQHLYILSDEEIKKGDRVYDTIEDIEEGSRIIEKATNDAHLDPKAGYKNIIATTDKSLKIESELTTYYRNGIGGAKNLPQIPQDFISLYIEQYNKGNKIKEVMVEYHNNLSDPERLIDFDVPYVPDNTISIKPIKDSWNEKDVMKLMRRSYNLCTQDNEVRSTNDFDNWAKNELNK